VAVGVSSEYVDLSSVLGFTKAVSVEWFGFSEWICARAWDCITSCYSACRRCCL